MSIMSAANPPPEFIAKLSPDEFQEYMTFIRERWEEIDNIFITLMFAADCEDVSKMGIIRNRTPMEEAVVTRVGLFMALNRDKMADWWPERAPPMDHLLTSVIKNTMINSSKEGQDAMLAGQLVVLTRQMIKALVSRTSEDRWLKKYNKYEPTKEEKDRADKSVDEILSKMGFQKKGN